jgi:hypothetical protein
MEEGRKDLAIEINKINHCKIEHPKTKNAYKCSIEPLTKAFDNNKPSIIVAPLNSSTLSKTVNMQLS